MKTSSVLFGTFFLFSIWFVSAYAKDADQYAPGYVPEADWSKIKSEEKPVENPYQKYELPASTTGEQLILPSEGLDSGIGVMGADTPNRLVYDDIELLSPQMRKTKATFSFQYFHNSPDIKDSRGIFKRTYKDDPKAIDFGPLGLSVNRIWRKGLEFTTGANIGFRYLNGRGSFAEDTTFSETKFTLWSIPLEFGLGFNVPIGNIFKLSFAGGPGVMGLFQTRNDMESGEKNKNRRQVGYGYFYAGEFKFNLSRLFPNWGFSFYRSYQAPMAFLGVNYKYQNYSNFQDDLSMSGSTLGLSFGLEYL